MSDDDYFFLYTPDDEFLTALPEELRPESDFAMDSISAGQENGLTSDLEPTMFPSVEPSSEDAQLAGDMFEEDEDPEPPGLVG